MTIEQVKDKLRLEEFILNKMKQADPESPSVPFHLGKIDVLVGLLREMQREPQPLSEGSDLEH